MTNNEKSEIFFRCGFWVAGVGHFDVTKEEFALILGLLNENDEEGLKRLYERLAQDRLG